jgi:hypothetical protein
MLLNIVPSPTIVRIFLAIIVSPSVFFTGLAGNVAVLDVVNSWF